MSLPQECDAAFATNGAQYAPVDATIEFSNETYQESGNVIVTSQPIVDAACLKAQRISDVAAFCASLDTTYKQQFGNSSTCSVAAGECHCSVTQTTRFNQSGNYEVQGSELIFSSGTTRN